MMLRIALLLCLAAAQSAGAADAPSAEQTFQQSIGLEDYKSITYRAEDGRVISAEEFLAGTASGLNFSIFKKHRSDGTREATLRLQSHVQETEHHEPPALAVQIGEPLPQAAHPDLQGVVRNLGGPRAKPLLISFFFVDCIPCIREVPELNSFAKAHEDFDVLAVTFEPPADARAFVAKRGLTWPVIAGAGAYIEKLGVNVYPTMLLVAPDGKLIATRTGGAMEANALATTPTLEQWVRSTCCSSDQAGHLRHR